MTFDRRNYREWPRMSQAVVLPVVGLLVRNEDITWERMVWRGA